MTTDDLERRIRLWLSAEAPSDAPAVLRARVLAIPTTAPTASWWHRFATVPMVGASIAAGLAVALVVVQLSTGSIGPGAGQELPPCGDEQIAEALDGLRGSLGHRFVQTDQELRAAGGDAATLAWSNLSIREVAYLPPNRTREIVTWEESDDAVLYLELLRIGNDQYERRNRANGSAWFTMPRRPTANWAYDRLRAELGTLDTSSVPGIGFGEAAVPEVLTGSEGCATATEVANGTIVGLRIDADDRLTDFVIGPANEVATVGSLRTLYEIEHVRPDASEFAYPAEAFDPPSPSDD